ncbi:MAG: hypothetical protein V7638_2310 [Acidobacteriota bacterium]|jgi:acyl-CoA reductase-like NAD-dependent aldehyde dehydrogenase
MEDDLEGKTLEELEQVQQQLKREIDVMSEMRARQIESAINAAGEAAKDLTSERHIDIRATINSRFQAPLDDLYNQLAACERRIDRLTQNQNPG